MESNGVQVVDEILEELKREDERRHGRSEPESKTVRRSTPRSSRPLAGARSSADRGRDPGRRSRRAHPPGAGARRRPSGPGEGSFDPVRMYLKEIGKVPLLTGAQEVSLAKRIEAGLDAVDRVARSRI